MSTSHAEHDHGHGSGNGDHVPHVLPFKVYIGTFSTLLFLTVVTVGASYVDLGHMGNLIVALLIATIKASVVALIFMHLKWDHKFHAIIFVSALIFLAVFIGITMSDTQFRGEAEAIEGKNPVDLKDPFKGERTGDIAVPKAVAAPAAAGSAAPAAGSAAPAATPAKH
ncbi:cytochrome C oxidase subunit IV family protein [Polyangium mundeleinium]|uniref:Cytochrome C oxidase subunit IV family protein n=1 Tax=Polyangium mundeleinium TaxID=2995306 RepID=A0ABT5ESQ0_9BACT|nr:cytochrome C oxidase subunit IV family protein [Polyangium mundeleinium]MDC0743952.1 cytochrome C oxidase subunit IV family protein [Polyangium mundeleinium]